MTLLSDARCARCSTELGLDDEMQWVETKTGYYADGRLSSVSNTVEFLRLPGSAARVASSGSARTILHGSRVKDWERLEQEPVETGCTRWSGPRTFERFWLPLLRAKLGES